MNNCSARLRAPMRPVFVATAALLASCAAPSPPPAPPLPMVEAVPPVQQPTAPMIWAVPKRKPTPPPVTSAAAPVVVQRPATARLASAVLAWPVHGQIVRGFGMQPSGTRNDGVDIAAAEGTPVVAVEDGVVTYAGGDLPGYGNMLLVTHPDGYVSVYAHNQRLLAAVGATVRRGQPIATVGHTGGGGETRLHFQLRAGERPVDPEPLLEPLPTVVASLAPDERPLGAR